MQDQKTKMAMKREAEGNLIILRWLERVLELAPQCFLRVDKDVHRFTEPALYVLLTGSEHQVRPINDRHLTMNGPVVCIEVRQFLAVPGQARRAQDVAV